jgi:hypothetical protein
MSTTDFNETHAIIINIAFGGVVIKNKDGTKTVPYDYFIIT